MKGIGYNPLPHHSHTSWITEGLEVVVGYTTKLRETTGSNWIVQEMIRLLVFAKLELRHSCCDLARVYHLAYDFDATVSPVPRYTRTETQRIRDEDAGLRDLTEELIPTFFAQYQESDEDLPCCQRWTGC